MLIDLKRIAASVCPECSNASIGYMSIFSFSGGRRLKITCPIHGCGAECVDIAQKGKKIKINIKCPYCGGVHSHSVDYDKFWKKDLLSFPCPEVGIGTFFIGERAKVEEALNLTLNQYSSLYEDTMLGLDDLMNNLDNLYDDEDENEDDILYDILDEIYDLRSEGSICCICGSEAVSINVVGTKILLSCPKCRRSKVIEANPENLAMIMNATAIVLGK